MYIIPLQLPLCIPTCCRPNVYHSTAAPLCIPTKGDGQSALKVRNEVRALLALEKFIDANV